MPVFSIRACIEQSPNPEFKSALVAREQENFVRLLYLAQFPEIAAAAVYAASIAGPIGWDLPLNWLLVGWSIMLIRFFVIRHALADTSALEGRFFWVLVANFGCGLSWGGSAFYFTKAVMKWRYLSH